MFSIVIPLYNKAPYVKAAVDSVLAQTIGDFEIIVIDDGSQDDGVDIVESINDPRIRLFMQANAGVSSTRNTGIKVARREWVCFLDADDCLHPRYLETLKKAFTAAPDCDAVATGYRQIRADQWDQEILNWPMNVNSSAIEVIDDLPTRWIDGAPFGTFSVAIKRDLLKQLSPCFAENESVGEDLDLWFRVGEQTAFAYCPSLMSAYRADVPGSLATNETTCAEPPFLLRLEARARSGETPINIRQSTLRLVNHLRITMARTATSQGQRLQALKLCWRARESMADKRWWITVVLAAIAPAALVGSFQRWREQRVRSV